MQEENDSYPGVPCLESYSEPVSGQIYQMYHGTSQDTAKQVLSRGFQQSQDGMLGRGVYLSRDLNKASRYPLHLPEHERVVIRVKVNVGKVKKIDRQHLNMWEEDDLYPGVPCLESYSEPVSGKIYRMYHGTSRNAAKQILSRGFQQSQDGMLGRGVYLSRDLNKASRYPLHLPEHERVVIRVKVDVGRVKKIDYQRHPMQKTWHDHGYDTAWCPPKCGMVPSGLEEDCVWDPQRIQIISNERSALEATSALNMWTESDLYPGVPCLQTNTEPVSGKIYRMYHGTTERAAEEIKVNGFQQSQDGMLGRGVYLSRDLNKASRYPLESPHERVVIRVKVDVGRVKKINQKSHPMQKTWHDNGYDTAWCPPKCGMVPSGLEEDCVWDPKRITVIDVIPPSLQNTISADPVEGKTYTMFYGTSKEDAEKIKANGFYQSNGTLGRGVYLSRDVEKAFNVPTHLPMHQRSVLRVKVDVGRVKKIDHQRHPMQKTWHDNGYDTAWCPPKCGMVPSDLEKDCVWDPRRITVIDVIRPI
ncbi:GCRV-induced protein 2e [Pimephales promelas]|nr:GCRV-induced protein 2e [Pimephales promelas]